MTSKNELHSNIVKTKRKVNPHFKKWAHLASYFSLAQILSLTQIQHKTVKSSSKESNHKGLAQLLNTLRCLLEDQSILRD